MYEIFSNYEFIKPEKSFKTSEKRMPTKLTSKMWLLLWLRKRLLLLAVMGRLHEPWSKLKVILSPWTSTTVYKNSQMCERFLIKHQFWSSIARLEVPVLTSQKINQRLGTQEYFQDRSSELVSHVRRFHLFQPHCWFQLLTQHLRGWKISKKPWRIFSILKANRFFFTHSFLKSPESC